MEKDKVSDGRGKKTKINYIIFIMMTQEDNKEINWVRGKRRFINTDLQRLKSLHKKLVGGYVDWKCPYCVRKAIDQLINYQTKNESKID